MPENDVPHPHNHTGEASLLLELERLRQQHETIRARIERLERSLQERIDPSGEPDETHRDHAD